MKPCEYNGRGYDPPRSEGPPDLSQELADAQETIAELLAACEDVLCALPERSPMRPVVRAAIAKAKGETP